MSTKPIVLCIVGPTACGKTALSVEAAIVLNGEVLSADAVAVYRGLDIGSAKPTEAERRHVPHHLIDCTDITDSDFTVSTFRTLAREAIDGDGCRSSSVGAGCIWIPYLPICVSQRPQTPPFVPISRKTTIGIELPFLTR